MELLNKIADTYPSDILKDCVIIGCQSFQSSMFPLIQKLVNKSIREVSLIGPEHNSDPETIEKLKALPNVNISEMVPYNSHSYYYDYFMKNAQDFLEKELERIEKNDCSELTLIILDEGGMLIEEINSTYEAHYPEWRYIVGVEQTTSGYNLLAKQELHLPVVDVATSRWKKTHESTFIARDCINALLNLLKYKYDENIHQLNYLIVGIGAVGGNIMKLLKTVINEENIFGYDTDPEKGYTQIPDLSTIDVVIGATGNTGDGENSEPIACSILNELEESKSDKKVYFASTSFFDVEFGKLTLEMRESSEENQELEFNHHYKNGILLNSGFPINCFEDAALEDIQLTRSLMFCGIIQTLEEDSNGLNDLFSAQLSASTN
jgi:hypothetical protein